MRINHNIAAANTHRQLTGNTSAASKSLEKLSSGLRINRAGDDAAGLAISEKMRAQVRGLDMAAKNAQDGISLIQTAEGALNETHSILQRMRELADQSANGTNTAEDRVNLQDEIKQLKEEVDRIGNNTEFNTQKLLNGALKNIGSATAGDNATISGKVLKETAGKAVGAAITTGAATVFTVKDTVIVDGTTLSVDWSNLSTDDQNFLKGNMSAAPTADEGKRIRDLVVNKINESIDKLNASNGTNLAHISGTFDTTAKKLTLTSGTEGNYSSVGVTVAATSVLTAYAGGSVAAATNKGQNLVTEAIPSEKLRFEINGVTLTTKTAITAAGSGTDAATAATDIQTKINTVIADANTASGLAKGDKGFIENVTVEAKEGRLYITSPSGNINFTEQDGGTIVKTLGLDQASTTSAGQGALTFQIGANKGQTIGLNIEDMRTNSLGIDGVDIGTAAGAQDALTKLDDSIKKVSSERSKMGAVQNRLEHTINNLQTASENLTAAESRIRDVDMAKEMMDFTKNNILSQAAQAMLAQANQQPQGVLQLLR